MSLPLLTPLTEKYLIEYVTEQHLTPESIDGIHAFCKLQSPKTMTLYRGHDETPTIRSAKWFSVTKSKETAKNEFAGKECCVFTIHIINVPMIDINSYIRSKIRGYKEEEEYIVLGGGNFYKDSSLSETGFNDIGNGEFECYYTLTSPEYDTIISSPEEKKATSIDVVRCFNRIPEEEYDLIDTIDDIDMCDVIMTDEQKQELLDMILQKKQELSGGKKNRSKTRRKTKSRRRIKHNRRTRKTIKRNKYKIKKRKI